MVIFAAIGGIGTAFLDLAPIDEEEKRALKAGVWASMAVAGAATGIDSTSAVVGGVMAAKELAGIVVEDEGAMQVIDASASVVSGAATGNVVEIAKVGAGAAAGAAIGGSQGGLKGMATGMQMGSQLATGNVGSMAGKAVGAGVGVGLAAAGSQSDDGKMLLSGAQLGMSVGGTIADAASTEAMVAQGKALRPTETPLPAPKPEAAAAAAAKSARTEGLLKLGGQAAGAGTAAAIDEAQGKETSLASIHQGVKSGGGLASAGLGIDKTIIELDQDQRGAVSAAARLTAHAAGLAENVATPIIDRTRRVELAQARKAKKQGVGSELKVKAAEAQLKQARDLQRILQETAGLRMA